MITNISVLNAVKDNSADFFVDANGFLNITGCPAVKAKTAKVNTIAIVQPTAGITTITFTPQVNYTYAFRVTGYDSNNNRITVPFYYTTPASGVNATTIATAVRAMIAASIIGAQFASIGGTDTVVLTGTLANPLISFENFNRDPNIVISAVGSGTTLGIEAQGYGADLLVAYGGFIGGSSIVPTNYYTQHEITLTPDVMFGGQAITEWGSTTYIVLVNASATAFAGSTDNVAVNIDLINNANYGAVALLKAGYRAVAPTTAVTTTAAITATTGAIALASGAVTFASLGAESGDYLVINSGTTFSTSVSTKITGITGAAAGFGTNIVAQSAAAFKYIAVRNIPN